MAENKGGCKLNVAIIHPDLGIGNFFFFSFPSTDPSHGHKVHVFTSHHDKNRCFEETVSGYLSSYCIWCLPTPTSIYRLHALCAYIQCPSVALCMLFMWPSFDVSCYCHFPDLLLAQHNSAYVLHGRSQARIKEEGEGTFKHVDARGVEPAVLYPAVSANFLSINRFERKKKDLAISAFSFLHTLEGDVLQGGFDNCLRENVEYLEELRSLAETEGVSNQVNFITSCSTAERNALLSQCLCDEHFGIVPLEAMVVHLPVIACNSGAPTCRWAQRWHVTESFSTKIFRQHLNQYIVDVARTKRD
ncbi:unnamed protein product [Malus baccata var. baccata]